MKWISVQQCLWITGTAWLVVSQSVVAKTIATQEFSPQAQDRMKEPPLLIQHAANTTVLHTPFSVPDARFPSNQQTVPDQNTQGHRSFKQSPQQTTHDSESTSQTLAQRTIIEITGVQLNVTETGLDITLSTANEPLAMPSTSVTGNALIAEIPDAVLTLPDGDDFQAASPMEGIAFITVSNLPGDRVQVAITGAAAPPTATVSASSQALLFSVVPETESATVPAETAEAGDDGIRIVVTAEKTPQDSQDVPISLTVLTRDELEDAQINSLQEIASNVPNFYFNPINAAGSYFSYYSIRGLGNSNFLNRDAVGFYIDDVPYDYGGFLDLNLIDLERVEVLRGPQNTLYGRSSQAGVVNIISRPPTNFLEVRSAASYGTENDRSLQLSISDAIIPDELSFRLAGAYSARDGFFENTFLDKSVGEESSLAGRAQLVWTPAPEWNISFNANVSADDDGAPIVVPFDSPDPFEIEQDFDGFYDSSNNTQALRVAYAGSGLRATSITTRRYSYQDSQVDADATALDLFRRLATYDSTVWSQELRLQSPETANQFQWLLGAYYEANDFNAIANGFEFSQLAAQQLGLPSAGFDRTDYEIDRDTYAVFGQVDYQPIEPLTLTAGLRYEASDSELDRRRVFEIAGLPPIPTGRTFDGVTRDDSELLPRLAAEYRLSPNVMAYASIAKGYRPGGLNPTAESDDVLEYEEETSWNYELGLKTSWFDDRLAANLAVFTTQVNDYQVLLRGFDALSNEIVNADARINGVELELRATPLEGLDLIAGFGYVDAEFTDYVNPFTNDRFDGNQLPYAPEYTYNLAAQYRSPGGLFTRLELQGSGTAFFDDANRFKQDPFALVNTRIGYEWDRGGVYLFATNLFDTEYITTAFAALGQDFASYGDRRIFGVQVRANF
ncbi:MAG: TonB-dependent siderophore receptor [Cyanobacteria bacterium P01_H01_bin.153]